jgi:hypothetical protein
VNGQEDGTRESSRMPETEAERRSVLEQLERMLAHPLFKTSKRYPSMLRFIVEHSLAEDADRLKERVLGIEVFGREPDYDTNQDPVVRTTAGEIRKRIAQYYHEPGHESEIRIDLPVGSYVPDFCLPVVQPAVVPPCALPHSRRPRNFVVLAALVAALVLGAVAWMIFLIPKSALNRFWEPVMSSNNAVLICLSSEPIAMRGNNGSIEAPSTAGVGIDARSPLTVLQMHGRRNPRVVLSEAIVLCRLTGLLQTLGIRYEIRDSVSTNLADLRSRPVVLIGAFNNSWILRLMEGLRFSFHGEPPPGKASVGLWIGRIRPIGTGQ